MAEETGIGYLIINTRTADNALPVEGVEIGIYSNGEKMTSLITDKSGIAGPVSIITPPRSSSLSPGAEKPYSVVDIESYKDGYVKSRYEGVAIYSGVTSIQPISLIPIERGISENSMNVFEGGVPEL